MMLYILSIISSSAISEYGPDGGKYGSAPFHTVTFHVTADKTLLTQFLKEGDLQDLQRSRINLIYASVYDYA